MMFLVFLISAVFSACSPNAVFEGDSQFFDCAKCEYQIDLCEVPQNDLSGYADTLLAFYGVNRSVLSCRSEGNSLTNYCFEGLDTHPMTLDECLDAMYTGITLVPTANECRDCENRLIANTNRSEFTLSLQQMTTGGEVGCACISNLGSATVLPCPGDSGGGGNGGRSSSSANALNHLF